MKFLEEKYPVGSLPGQKTPGRYIDGYLAANLDILAEKIVDDLQFLGICCSSTFEVRSGKSTFLQHIGEYYTHKVNEMHGLNLTFDMKNIVFNSTDLIERAGKLPKYSFLVLDENDEIDEHYFSKLAKDLRRFFRKSGQLNLFIMIVVPNFFQLKSGYAISRSNFLLDVKFEGKFERGYFGFYNFEKKKELYVKGKKTQDYNIVKPDFVGRFTKGYAVDERAYREAKRIDLIKNEKEEVALTPEQIRRKLFIELRNKMPNLTVQQLADGFGIAKRTAFRWLANENEEEEITVVGDDAVGTPIINNLMTNHE